MRSAFGIIELVSSAPRRPAVYRARRSNGRRSLPANIYNAHGRTGGTGRGRGASALRAAVLIERRKGIRSLPPSPVPRESLEDRDHDRRARDAQSRSFICRYPSRRMPSPRLAPPRSSTILEITSASLSRARTRFSSDERRARWTTCRRDSRRVKIEWIRWTIAGRTGLIGSAGLRKRKRTAQLAASVLTQAGSRKGREPISGKRPTTNGN